MNQTTKLCIYCKGMHSYKDCPQWHKSLALYKLKNRLNSSDFSSSTPAPFIGRFGYPEINVGILAPPEVSKEAWLYDAPKYWSEKNYEVSEIIGLRVALVNSNFKSNVKSILENSKLLDVVKEVGMASKPVDIDVILKEKPAFNLKLDVYTAPRGPNAKLQKIEVTENPKIHTKVQNFADDNDILAKDVLVDLYSKGFDENFLTKLLSVGVLGLKNNKKLVPTRWSITAIDDMLGKSLLPEIKDFDKGDYCAYFGSYLGNYYLVLMFPSFWSYELFETSLETKGTTTDYESFVGRKNYAENCVGGYYTVRLAVAEKLKEVKKQNAVLVLRFISNEYTLPLGVWVTREASRKTLLNKPIKFVSKELMLTYSKNLINKKFGFDISNILQQSLLLKGLKQMRLESY